MLKGGGERAIKSLPKQPGMTHTTDFIHKRENGRGKWKKGRLELGSHLKIISGNKPTKGVMEPHTIIPQPGPDRAIETCLFVQKYCIFPHRFLPALLTVDLALTLLP